MNRLGIAELDGSVETRLFNAMTGHNYQSITTDISYHISKI